jgi:hypothetical protein
MGIQPVAKLGAPVLRDSPASAGLASVEIEATWRQAFGSVNTTLQPEHR